MYNYYSPTSDLTPCPLQLSILTLRFTFPGLAKLGWDFHIQIPHEKAFHSSTNIGSVVRGFSLAAMKTTDQSIKHHSG